MKNLNLPIIGCCMLAIAMVGIIATIVKRKPDSSVVVTVSDSLNTAMYQKAEDSLDVLWYQMMDSVKKSIHDADYNKAGTYLEKASAYDHASNILYHFQFNQAIQNISNLKSE